MARRRKFAVTTMVHDSRQLVNLVHHQTRNLLFDVMNHRDAPQELKTRAARVLGKFELLLDGA